MKTTPQPTRPLNEAADTDDNPLGMSIRLFKPGIQPTNVPATVAFLLVVDNMLYRIPMRAENALTGERLFEVDEENVISGDSQMAIEFRGFAQMFFKTLDVFLKSTLNSSQGSQLSEEPRESPSPGAQDTPSSESPTQSPAAPGLDVNTAELAETPAEEDHRPKAALDGESHQGRRRRGR